MVRPPAPCALCGVAVRERAFRRVHTGQDTAPQRHPCRADRGAPSEPHRTGRRRADTRLQLERIARLLVLLHFGIRADASAGVAGAKLPVRLLRPPYRAGHPCVMAAGLRAVPPVRWKPGMEPGRRRLGALGHGKHHLALLMVRALHPLSVRRLLPVRPLRARTVDGAGAGRVDPGRDDSRRAGRLGAVLVFVRFGFPRRSFLRPSRGVAFGFLPAPSMVLPSGRARIAPRGRSILPVEEGVGQCSLFRSPAAHGGGAPHAGGH